MKKIITLVLLLCSGLFSSYSLAQDKQSTDADKLVSALPILHAINQALLQNTQVSAVYLPPKRLPVSRISNWLKHKSVTAINKQGQVTALVTVESIWPDYALLKHLRVNNVRVVEIDAVEEILTGGARVRLSDEDIGQGSYFWLLPDNLIVMSQIVARDLQRLWPQHAQQIGDNQNQLQQQISEFSLQMDQLLLDKQVMDVCLADSKLGSLAQATYLPVSIDQCPEQGLTIKTKGRKSVPEKGIWWVDPAIKPLKKGLAVWLDSNLASLKQALNS